MSEDFEYITRVAGLILKYHRNELTEEESLDLRVWCAQSKHNQALFDRLSDPEFIREGMREIPDMQSLKRAGWEKVLEGIGGEDLSVEVLGSADMVDLSGQQGSKRGAWGTGGRVAGAIRHWKLLLAAAAVIICALITGNWLMARRNTRSAVPDLAMKKGEDIAPGGNKAVLTLSDGSSVTLDSTADGKIARQAGRDVRQSSGVLSYGGGENLKPGFMAYNTLTTPAAGQFRVVLPDGSKVFLNNASSLRYPVVFTGASRVVELTGEGYFEVAKNSTQPFHVKVGAVDVTVLGTSFNIYAYKDEGVVKTSLLTGGVRVDRGAESAVLKPGQQARVDDAGMKTIGDIDMEGVVAWKNGFFHFDHASLETVMRMLARWYDVEIVYAGAIPDRMFGGDIQRNLSLSQVLEILERNKVHFDLEGRRITVRP